MQDNVRSAVSTTSLCYFHPFLGQQCVGMSSDQFYDYQFRKDSPTVFSGVYSRASRMLRGATQPVRMPCVCVWKLFF